MLENLNLNAVQEKKVYQKIRLKEIYKRLQENLSSEIYIGELTELKNQKQNYYVKKLKKIWDGAMTVTTLTTIKKFK